MESYNNCGLLRGDTQCDHPTTSFNYNVYDLKCRVAKNISRWLKVQSCWFKNHIFANLCILISFWIHFSNFSFFILSHFITVPYFTLWMLDFFSTIWVSNSLDPDQARHFFGPDLGPNCLQRLSADIKIRP